MAKLNKTLSTIEFYILRIIIILLLLIVGAKLIWVELSSIF